MRRLLVPLAVLLAFAPAALGQQPATAVSLSAYERTTVSWNGPAGQTWQVILIGKQGTQALPVTSKRKIAVDYITVAPAAQWGDDVTAYVAPCAAPQETYEASVAGKTGVYAFCTPVPDSWAASSTTVLQGPPSLMLNDALTRGRVVAWKVERGREYAAPTGYTVRYRPDVCPAASSNTAPCPGRKPWRQTTLKAAAKSFSIPGATSGTYWDVQVTAASDAGKSDVLDLGIYIT